MPLLDMEQLRVELICPRCSASLADDPSRCGACLLEFPQANGLPVLVDFENSVLERDAVLSTGAQSLIPRGRRGRLKIALRRVIFGENPVAGKHATKLATLAGRLQPRPRILVVGGATVGSGLQAFYSMPNVDVIAFDIYSSAQLQFIADAHSVPLKSQSVDGVIIQAVLEHVIEPQRVVSEIQRVLRPGGLVYAETPFLQQVHEGPYDFTRFTESGHRYLFRHFREIDTGVVFGPGTQMIWSIDHLFRGLFRSRKAGTIAKAAFFWVRWLDRFVPSAFAVDSASGFYFLGSLSDKPMTPREAIVRYRGAQ